MYLCTTSNVKSNFHFDYPNSYLAFVGLMRAENFQKKGLIDFNIDCLKRSLGRLSSEGGSGGGGKGHVHEEKRNIMSGASRKGTPDPYQRIRNGPASMSDLLEIK